MRTLKKNRKITKITTENIEDNDFDLTIALLRGSDISYDNIILRSLSLDKISEDFGLSNFLGLLHMFTTMKKEKLIDRKYLKQFTNIGVFDIILQIDGLREKLIEFLKMITLHDEEEDAVVIMPNIAGLEDVIVISYEGVFGKINNLNFEKIMKLLKLMYCVTEEKKDSERTDIDDELAELLKEFEEAEEKVSKNACEINLASMIEAVSVKSHTLNLLNIWSYTMYQFMQTYYRIEQIDSCENITKAVYAGTVDSKEINMKDYHWSKKLTVNEE